MAVGDGRHGYLSGVYQHVGSRFTGVLSGVWDIAFFINNVTNARAFLALDQERGTLARIGYLTNPPRRVGISTRVSF